MEHSIKVMDRDTKEWKDVSTEMTKDEAIKIISGIREGLTSLSEEDLLIKDAMVVALSCIAFCKQLDEQIDREIEKDNKFKEKKLKRK